MPEAAAHIWAVAGCLFEVSLPAAAEGTWRWSGARPEVTLLAERAGTAGRRHFRFRAESPGRVELAFEDSGRGTSVVVVKIAPEQG